MMASQINQDGFLFPNITDDGLLDSTVSELFTFNSTCSIGELELAMFPRASSVNAFCSRRNTLAAQ